MQSSVFADTAHEQDQASPITSNIQHNDEDDAAEELHTMRQHQQLPSIDTHSSALDDLPPALPFTEENVESRFPDSVLGTSLSGISSGDPSTPIAQGSGDDMKNAFLAAQRTSHLLRALRQPRFQPEGLEIVKSFDLIVGCSIDRFGRRTDAMFPVHRPLAPGVDAEPRPRLDWEADNLHFWKDKFTTLYTQYDVLWKSKGLFSTDDKDRKIQNIDWESRPTPYDPEQRELSR